MKNEYFLVSTGDQTDRTAQIAECLQKGYCKLGPGVFYVKNLQMPDGSVLSGCGSSRICLSEDVTNGYAVRLGNECRIGDLTFSGAEANIDVSSETVGTRHGILFSGTYDVDEGTTKNCMIDNVRIAHFNGGGITLCNTGYPTSSSLVCNNAIITNCGAGIHISYWSEYHHFNNIVCHFNHYGCINNGGNNIFTNCCFSENELGMLFDNSDGQKKNNSHGSVIGCLFNHSARNEGVGVKMVNMHHGEVFSGCQLFFSDIVIENSSGLIFSNFVCGRHVTISVADSKGVLFDGCVFQPAPEILVRDSNNVRFLNCFDKNGNSIGADRADDPRA